MDSLITALFLLVVSALATWLKKKGATPGTDDSSSDTPQTPPSVNQPRPAPRPTRWEDELRRLLEGQPQAPPPPMRPPPMRPPPPLARPQPQQTTPTRPTVIRPVLVPPEIRPVLSPPRPTPLPAAVGSSIEVSAGQLAPLTQSKEAYERASQLGKNVSAHIDRVPGQRVLATNVIRRAASPEIVQAVSFFKNARNARQAVIASLILGPPRSIEEISPGF